MTDVPDTEESRSRLDASSPDSRLSESVESDQAPPVTGSGSGEVLLGSMDLPGMNPDEEAE
jgi:hypothetical protein